MTLERTVRRRRSTLARRYGPSPAPPPSEEPPTSESTDDAPAEPFVKPAADDVKVPMPLAWDFPEGLTLDDLRLVVQQATASGADGDAPVRGWGDRDDGTLTRLAVMKAPERVQPPRGGRLKVGPIDHERNTVQLHFQPGEQSSSTDLLNRGLMESMNRAARSVQTRRA